MLTDRDKKRQIRRKDRGFWNTLEPGLRAMGLRSSTLYLYLHTNSKPRRQTDPRQQGMTRPRHTGSPHAFPGVRGSHGKPGDTRTQPGVKLHINVLDNSFMCQGSLLFSSKNWNCIPAWLRCCVWRLVFIEGCEPKGTYKPRSNYTNILEFLAHIELRLPVCV